MAGTDNKYLSLLSLAEHFRVSNPPNIKLCIHCLQAIFNLKPPPRAEARTHMQLGAVLLQHTKNLDLAEKNLQDAVSTNVIYFKRLFVYFSVVRTNMKVAIMSFGSGRTL